MIMLTPQMFGLGMAIFSAIVAIAVLVRAIARVTRLERALADLDWASLSELVADVETLKRQAMKSRNTLNGLKRQTQKEDLEAKLQEVQHARQANVMPMMNVER